MDLAAAMEKFQSAEEWEEVDEGWRNQGRRWFLKQAEVLVTVVGDGER
jgi:hypothetical protein